MKFLKTILLSTFCFSMILSKLTKVPNEAKATSTKAHEVNATIKNLRKESSLSSTNLSNINNQELLKTVSAKKEASKIKSSQSTHKISDKSKRSDPVENITPEPKPITTVDPAKPVENITPEVKPTTIIDPAKPAESITPDASSDTLNTHKNTGITEAESINAAQQNKFELPPPGNNTTSTGASSAKPNNILEINTESYASNDATDNYTAENQLKLRYFFQPVKYVKEISAAAKAQLQRESMNE